MFQKSKRRRVVPAALVFLDARAERAQPIYFYQKGTLGYGGLWCTATTSCSCLYFGDFTVQKRTNAFQEPFAD